MWGRGEGKRLALRMQLEAEFSVLVSVMQPIGLLSSCEAGGRTSVEGILGRLVGSKDCLGSVPRWACSSLHNNLLMVHLWDFQLAPVLTQPESLFTLNMTLVPTVSSGLWPLLDLQPITFSVHPVLDSDRRET